MKKRALTQEQAIALLKKHFKSKKDYNKVLKHSLAVKKVAVRIAKQVNADIEFIKLASILHDIGRSVCPPHNKKSIRHGVEGAKILKKEKLPKFAKLAERHLGCGINKKDIKDYKLNLPMKCYIPLTKEEKVLSYADNLLRGHKVQSVKSALKEYEKRPGIVKKIISVHNQLVDFGYRKNQLHEPVVFEGITIIGEKEFVELTKKAISFISKKDPLLFKKIPKYVKKIVRSGVSGVVVKTGEFRVGKRSAKGKVLWYASSIVHEYAHVKYFSEKKVDPIGNEVKHEKVALRAQLNFLKKAKASKNYLDYIKRLIKDPDVYLLCGGKSYKEGYKRRDW